MMLQMQAKLLAWSHKEALELVALHSLYISELRRPVYRHVDR